MTQAEQRAKHVEATMRWFAKNPDKKKVATKRFYDAHRAKRIAQAVAWNKANIEKRRVTVAKYDAANSAAIVLRKKMRRHENPALVRAISIARRKRYLELYRARGRDYYARNRDKITERVRLSSAANPEKTRQRSKQYALKYPEKIRDRNRRRRVVKLNATIGDVGIITAWERAWRKKRRVLCYWCRGIFSPKGCHVDHIAPISRGGSHSIDNLAISCAKCNHSKHAASISEWNKRLVQPALL